MDGMIRRISRTGQQRSALSVNGNRTGMRRKTILLRAGEDSSNNYCPYSSSDTDPGMLFCKISFTDLSTECVLTNQVKQDLNQDF